MTSRADAFVLSGVTKTFGESSGQPAFCALSDVNLTIPRGALTTVVGPSGSGKSTLLGLLGLLDRPTTGDLTLVGHRASAIGERQRCALRASFIGFVFQAFHLMSRRTVVENVMLGGLYRGMSRAERAQDSRQHLERVGLSSKQHNKASTLSGGERQRVAIARALVGSPQILLCDEPTGNLDSKNGAEVVALLRELSATGITTVLVTHDPEIATIGTHQLNVVDGRVSGDGAS